MPCITVGGENVSEATNAVFGSLCAQLNKWHFTAMAYSSAPHSHSLNFFILQAQTVGLDLSTAGPKQKPQTFKY